MKEKHYKRGYYTGAFDILNKGHIKSLQLAASKCDQLVVGVSTDEVIKAYKHHEPAIPFEERLEIVAGIKGVTLAIPQYDLYNKLEVCHDIGADVIFSCDEYQRTSYPDPDKMTPKEIAGVERWEKIEQEANEAGIDVVYLPRTQGTSSSKIKERIIEMHSASTSSEETAYPSLNAFANFATYSGAPVYSEGEDCSDFCFD